MKKTISLMLIALLLVAVMAPTAYATARGETVTVTVTVTGDAFAGLSGTMSYDASALTYVSCSSTTGTPRFNAQGGYFSWFTDNNVSGTVSTISVTFTVNEDAPCGSAGISLSEILVGNQDGVAVEANVSVGSVSVDHIPGEEEKINDVPSTCSVAGGYDLVVNCTKCGEQISSEHVAYELAPHTESTVAGYEATCTESGLTDGTVCSVCNAIIKAQETIDALGHDWVEGTSTKGEDCQHTGVTNYTCSRCSEPKTESNNLKGDHKYEYKYNDTHHWTVCSVCGDTTEEQPHNFVDNGGEKLECVCGATKDKATTPSETTPPVETKPGAGGDMGDTTPYATFFLMAVAAVMGTAYGFKRKFVK